MKVLHYVGRGSLLPFQHVPIEGRNRDLADDIVEGGLLAAINNIARTLIAQHGTGGSLSMGLGPISPWAISLYTISKDNDRARVGVNGSEVPDDANRDANREIDEEPAASLTKLSRKDSTDRHWRECRCSPVISGIFRRSLMNRQKGENH
jgi:hypothetical protein